MRRSRQLTLEWKIIKARNLRRSGMFLRDVAENIGMSYTWTQKYTKGIPKPKRPAPVSRLPKGQSGFNRLLADYKRSARDRNIQWDLSRQEFFILTKCNCSYCGVAPSNIKRTSKRLEWEEYVYSGVDRIDNSLGYISGNVTACCRVCNKMKGTMTVECFIESCEKVISHNSDQPLSL